MACDNWQDLFSVHRIKALMGEMEKNPDVILFIDEIHTMIGAGGASGSMDASNMFKTCISKR